MGRVGEKLLLVFALSLAACGGELDPKDPDGAYLLWRDALFVGDGETVWSRSDADTHAFFEDQHKRLGKMDQKIERYLPSTDHKIARTQTGAVLADDVADGKALFLKIFDPSKMPKDVKFKLGTEIDTVEIAENDESAKLTTLGKQEWLLTKDKTTTEWHVRMVNSNDVVQKTLGWLKANEEALEQTVKDLADEELQKREEIIAELMNVKPKKGATPEPEKEAPAGEEKAN